MAPKREDSIVGMLLVLAGACIGYVIFQVIEDRKHIKLEKTELRSFQLVEIDPPVRMHVTLKDVKTGATSPRIYVSKYCSGWRDTAVVGNTYNIIVATYRDDRNGAETFEYGDLRRVFCG